MELKRHISTSALLFIALGGIIGSGWLFGPFFAARIAGPAAILSWVLGGCLMMLIALTFAELSSAFPFAGGTVRFMQLSHGTLVSFTMAWISWLSALAVAPIETLALIHYATNYIPGLMQKAGAQSVHEMTAKGIGVAAFLLLIVCVINVFGVKLLSKTNNIVVILKLIIPALTAIIFLCADFHLHNFIAAGFAPMGFKNILVALPTAGIIFSYIGYSAAIQLAAEVKTPQHSLPIAIIGALAICIVLYVVLQIAFIGAINPQHLAIGWQNLSFPGDAGPFAGIAIAMGIVWLGYLLYVDAFVSPLGTALVYTASAARIGVAMGENGYFPGFLQKINRFGVPARIIILNYCIGILLFLPFPTWQKLTSFLVSALVFAYGVGPLALMVLRKTMPEQHRPFQVPKAKLICWLAFYICNLIVFWTGWNIVGKVLIAIVIGYIVLFIFRQTKQGRQINFQWRKAFWIFIYLIGLGCISFLGTFAGGLSIIPFGWDFLVIAFFSWIIFELAIRAGVSA